MGLNAFWNFVATFTGVLFAIISENWNSKRKEKNLQDEIAPYIYNELAENWYLTSKRKGTFKTNYWEIYKNDLGKWFGSEIVKIVKVYNLMEDAIKADDYELCKELYELITSILIWFEQKAENNHNFEKKLEKVSGDFKLIKKEVDEETLEQYQPKYFIR
jgi:hypothetical protein